MKKFILAMGLVAFAFVGCDDSSSASAGPNEEIAEGILTDSRDGQTYKTITIGTQTWMAENLNYETSGSYCYNDSIEYCNKYGRLYTWEEAMESCPDGWHLPSGVDWENLFTAVGGKSTAGKVLKSQSGWSENGNGTDAFDFSALPAGCRSSHGIFNYDSSAANFWSSATEPDEIAFYSLNLYNFYEFARFGTHRKDHAASVRCVKD